MSKYFTSNIKMQFKAYINAIEITEQDEYYAINRFLENLSELINEIKSENPDFKFDKIPDTIIDEFRAAIHGAVEYGANYYQISDFISVERNYETEDLTDIYITYMGQNNTYFKEMNQLFETNGF